MKSRQVVVATELGREGGGQAEGAGGASRCLQPREHLGTPRGTGHQPALSALVVLDQRPVIEADPAGRQPDGRLRPTRHRLEPLSQVVAPVADQPAEERQVAVRDLVGQPVEQRLLGGEGRQPRQGRVAPDAPVAIDLEQGQGITAEDVVATARRHRSPTVEQHGPRPVAQHREIAERVLVIGQGGDLERRCHQGVFPKHGVHSRHREPTCPFRRCTIIDPGPGRRSHIVDTRRIMARVVYNQRCMLSA